MGDLGVDVPRAGLGGLTTRRAVVALGVALLTAPALYVGLGLVAYEAFLRTDPRCAKEPDNIQEPTSFVAWVEVDGARRTVDTTPYRMPAPQEVSFPARTEPAHAEPRVTIAAWWEPADRIDAPTVILVHGLNGCRRNSGNLLVAGMLHRHGFATLLIDMRDHGDSTLVDGRFAGGADEHLDVLGAFDWLRGRGVPAARIGVFGFSGGAIAAMVAMGEEPTLAAIWADSSWTDGPREAVDLLPSKGLPSWLAPAVVLGGRLLTGSDLEARTPIKAVAKLNGRPIYLAQGERDEFILPANLADLATAVRDAGGTVEPWLVPAAGHTQAHVLYPEAYEARLAAFFGAALGTP